MGLSKSKTKSNSTTNSTANATTTPNVPSYIQQPYQNYYGGVAALQNGGGPGAAVGPTANQQAAFTRASLLGGGGAQTDAQNATRGLLNYTPSAVAAGQLRDTDLSPYMDPYTQNVIDLSLADLERSRAGAISAGQGVATAAGAFGGSRHGVADSLTNEAFGRTVAQTAAALRSQGFLNAQQMAGQDIDRRFSADTFNSQQGLAGANFRLGAANQLGQQGLAADANERSNIGLMGDLGQTEREIAMQNDPQARQMQYMAQLAALLAAGNPELFTGQTSNQTGTSNTSGFTKGPGGLLGQLGSMFNGLGNMGVSFGGGGGK